jgi:hypothetical protein
MSAQDVGQSQIAVAPAMAGVLDAAVMASATVEAMPDAQAVLTAHAPGTVTRILKRIGDPVRAGRCCCWSKAAMPRRSRGSGGGGGPCRSGPAAGGARAVAGGAGRVGPRRL